MSELQNVPVKVRDFERFLKKCLDYKDLQVIDYVATTMLPPGENFCSLIVKIDATVQHKNKSSKVKEEILHFVAKTPAIANSGEVDWSLTIKPEVFAYTEIVPVYREIEELLNIEEKLEFYPKFIGYRYSLKEDEKDTIDENSMLLLENLTARGYYVGDKLIGLDYEHGCKVVECLARFHALGAALIKLRPDMLVKMSVQWSLLDFDVEQFDNHFDSALETIRSSENLKKHMHIIEPAFAEAKHGNMWTRTDNGPWMTIIHGDCWINNFLFHSDEITGLVDDVKLIDYQSLHCGSTFRDLSCLLCLSIDKTMDDNLVDRLIDLYYVTFVKWIERVGCDSTAMTRAEFTKELRRQAIIQFPLCTMIFRIFLYKTSQNYQEEMVKMLEMLIDAYEKRGWF